MLARTDLGRSQRLVVAGHLDTVVPNDNQTPRRDGEVLWGLGAADMKGSLAVMLDVAGALSEPAVDVTWCFYAREEVARAESGLLELLAARPELAEADAAILGEPTDGYVEAGCQGTLRAEVHMTGIRAHTARPFTGRNAIHRLAPVLDAVANWEGRSANIDGCTYTEQLQAVGISGGVAPNVVPDAASLVINYRFVPERDADGARAFLSGLVDGSLDHEAGDALNVVDVVAGALPSLHQPLLARLVELSGQPVRGKVGWTDVATFYAHGVPAANFGPGDPLLAHHPDERVDRTALEHARSVLAQLLGAP